MASKKLITFYVSKVVEPIKHKMNLDSEAIGLEADYTNEMIDLILKHNLELDKSKIEMTNEELINLCRVGFKVGLDVGLDIDFPEGELDKQLNLKDLK